MRSSFDARSMRFSMSRIDSKYSVSLTLSPRLIFGLQALRILPHLVEDAAIERGGRCRRRRDDRTRATG